MAARVFRFLIVSDRQPSGGRFQPPDTGMPMLRAYTNAIKALKSTIKVNGEEVPWDMDPYLKLIEGIDAVQQGEISASYDHSPFATDHDYLTSFDRFQCEIDFAHIHRFLPAYLIAEQGKTLLELPWGLSSGEWSFLNILSRIFDAHPQDVFGKKEGLEIEDENQPQRVPPFPFIILDEPCLHFHPAWQRNLVKYLVDLVPKIISGTQSQIIFSTHSPLTVADLPKHHIQFMKIDADDNISVSIPDVDFNTFGGDPLSMYRTAFGIQDGYFSGFARDKMEEYFDPIIKGRYFTPKEEVLMRKFVEMVGDETVRYKLKQLIDEKKKGNGQA
jgi:hypothetical protein